jgi:hypothetical protein
MKAVVEELVAKAATSATRTPMICTDKRLKRQQTHAGDLNYKKKNIYIDSIINIQFID